VAARRIQAGRLTAAGVHSNSEMTNALVERHCRLTSAAQAALRSAHDRVGLSARGHHRVLRVARTLADLEACDLVDRHHVFQAVAYRERPQGRALELAA
jgi:magnesium chelatase family protein